MGWLNRFLMMLAVCCLLTGCTAEQVAQLDKGLADANTVADSAKDVISGPVGKMLPEGIRQAVEIGLSLLGLAMIAWQRLRLVLLKRTGAAIVHAVETLDPRTKQAVKDSVKQTMKDREIYASANRIVDELKAV